MLECAEVRNDGDLGPWLETLDTSVAAISAREVGFRPAPGCYERFERSLHENPDAARLVNNVLPKCDLPRLAGFVALVANSGVEDRLIELTDKRGEGLKKIARSAARKNKKVQRSARNLVTRADRAFDTRRQGLVSYCFPILILRRYLSFRSGIEPTARELAALLKAGLAASGRPAHQQSIDYDLLRRNLKNYEKKHPHVLATGERCAQIIEVSQPTL